MSDLQVSIDPARCQGHALCLQWSPEHFEFDDVEGRGFVVEPAVAPHAVQAVRLAAANCPEQAITIG